MKKDVYYFLRKIGILRKSEEYLKNLRATQNEILKGLIFNNTIADSEWFKYKNVSPGLWAADYGLLYTLYRVLNGMKPKTIIEFGLGQSSKLVHQYADFYHVSAVTCEHDDKWIDFFIEGKDGIYDFNIQKLELETIIYKGYETITYRNLTDTTDDKKYDFILVDGPFGSDRFSRTQVVELAQNNLSDSFCIIMDDTNRHGEEDTVEEVKRILDEKNISYRSQKYYASKCHTLICSEDLGFLTSL